MVEHKPAVIQIDLFTGVQILMCRFCGGSTFLMDIETDHTVTVVQGLLTVKKPRLATDVIKQRLNPENITCAKCFKKEVQ